LIENVFETKETKMCLKT